MSSLDFCVCGGSKNQNQELCGECRMAEIEALTLRHTWQEELDDCDYLEELQIWMDEERDHREEYLKDQEKKDEKAYFDSKELGGCSTCNNPTDNWFCKDCYKTQEVICNQMESCKCGLDYKVGCKCLPF